jgi:hypothetical protein
MLNLLIERACGFCIRLHLEKTPRGLVGFVSDYIWKRLRAWAHHQFLMKSRKLKGRNFWYRARLTVVMFHDLVETS